jgi:hypothetical protein
MISRATKARSIFLFLSAMSVQAEAAASSANLLTNPSFDDLLLGWNFDAGYASAVSWVPDFGVPNSSGQVLGAIAIGGLGNSSTTVSQCVRLTGGITYQFSFSGLAFCESGAEASVLFTDSASVCSDDFGGLLGEVTQIGQWQRFSLTALAPESATAALITLTHNGGENCDEAVYFDEIFFGDQIFAGSFE